jgi:tetratricopeptide (TPR) repeat protein
VSPLNRMRLIVALLVVAAAGIVAGIVYATRQDPPQPSAQCKQPPKALIVPGVRSKHVAAVRSSLAQSPKAAAHALEPLALRNPRDPVVQFNFGTVLFCAGYIADAEQAFRAAKTGGYDTFYELQADAVLHPQFFDQGHPIFEPQGKDPLLLQGVLLQRRGKQHSAEKLYARAARLHPDEDEAQVAAAVGRFDEDNLSASFSRLGPLVKRFPKSQSVRYHLGLLLAWTGQRSQAAAEFRLARALGPTTTLGKEANVFLRGLVATGTSSTPK